MKRILSIALIFAIVFSFASCRNIDELNKEEETQIPTTTQAPPVVDEKKQSKEFQDENGRTVYVVDVVLPEISDNIPQNIIVISDLEFDRAQGWRAEMNSRNAETLMEGIARKWAAYGYQMPKLVYWNVQCRQNNIPQDLGNGRVSYVSGMSPSIFQTIMTGKTGYELMMAKLNDARYSVIE